jgi:chromosome segregation ATPase
MSEQPQELAAVNHDLATMQRDNDYLRQQLADERERTKKQGKTACDLFDECKKLQKQLADEREITKTLTNALHSAEDENQKLKQQLATEQEQIDTQAKTIFDAMVKVASLEQQNIKLRHRLRVYEYDSPEPDQGESVLGYGKTPHGLPNPP